MKASKPDTPLPESTAVEAYLAGLAHPLASEVRRVRRVILDADKRLREGVKWNAPSFYFGEWFATFHLRSPEEIALILHRGAKTKAPLRARFVREDEGLVVWLANDRGKVVFRDAAGIEASAEALQRLIRRWIDAMAAETPPGS